MFPFSRHKKSVSYGYMPFVLLVLTVVFLLSCLLGWIVYKTNISLWKTRADIASHQIAQAFQEKLQETNSIVTHTGRRLVQMGVNDLEKIAANICAIPTNNDRESSSYTWTFLDWIDTTDHMRVSQIGIIANPPDMKMREYTKAARLFPWTLQLCRPAVGIPSGIWIIPFGMGIQDDFGNHLGIISGGLQVEHMIRIFERAIGHEKIDFLVLDDQLNTILCPSQINPHQLTYKGGSLSSALFDPSKSQLNNPICFDKIHCYNYRRIKNSPYILLTGFNTEVVQREFINAFIPYLFEMIVISFICLIVLYMLWKKMADSVFYFSNIAKEISQGKLDIAICPQQSLEMRHFANSLEEVVSYIKQCELKYREVKYDFDLAKTSNEAKEAFLRQLNADMQNSLIAILAHAKALLKSLKGELDIELSKETRTQFLTHITSTAFELQRSTSNILNPSTIDVKAAIETALSVRLRDAFLKKITLHYSVDPSIPPSYLDEVKFKQVILGLISRAILYTPVGGKINVTAKMTSSFLEVVIQDTGFGLTEEDIERLLDRFDPEQSWKKVPGIDLDFSTIEKLTKLQGGHILTENLWGEGSTVKTLFPCTEKAKPGPGVLLYRS